MNRSGMSRRFYTWLAEIALRSRRLGCLVVLCSLAHADEPTGQPAFSVAQAADPGGAATRPHALETPDSLTETRVFDFNERPLGNFEDLPMHWFAFTGDGLPSFSRGSFDDAVGHLAPPSLRFDLHGGNIGYEYRGDDLTVSPDSDYVVSAYIRAAGIRHASVFIATYLLDENNERIANSEQITPVIRSVAAADFPVSEIGANNTDEPWQRVELVMASGIARAQRMRLQLWLLQDYASRPADPSQVDPIERQDVCGKVWFDDLTIRRVPHVRLRLSAPGNLVTAGKDATLSVTFQSSNHAALTAELQVVDRFGAQRTQRSMTLEPGAAAPLELKLPELECGVYAAEFALRSGQDRLLQRRLRFVVLPPEDPADPGLRRHRDMGIDVGNWSSTDAVGLAELITTVQAGSVRIGLTAGGAVWRHESALRALHDLLRGLALAEVDATGILLAPAEGDGDHERSATRAWVASEELWCDQFAPLLARFGGLLSNWQLGTEAIELRDAGGWTDSALQGVRKQLDQIIPVTELVVPNSIFENPATQDTPAGDTGKSADVLQLIPSYWIPLHVPTRSLAWQTTFIAAQERDSTAKGRQQTPIWAALEYQQGEADGQDARLAELARRVSILKVAGPDRIYLPAPFEHSPEAGGTLWQPTEDFLVQRTLFRTLAGKRPMGVLKFPNDAVGLLFGDADDNCLVLWSWRDDPHEAELELFLGPTPFATDLWGTPVPLQQASVPGGQAAIGSGGDAASRAALWRLPVRTSPIFLTHISAPLVLLQSSFDVSPTLLELHDPNSRPVIRFRNPFDEPVSGTVSFRTTRKWEIVPRAVEVKLPPGAEFSQALDIALPPRQVAANERLMVTLELRRPISTTLEFHSPLEIGLRNIAVETLTHWMGDDLIVTQRLQNRTDQPVSFTAFCQAPTGPRLEREFINVPANGEQARSYRIRGAAAHTGGSLYLGIREIRGKRGLDQLVEIPK